MPRVRSNARQPSHGSGVHPRLHCHLYYRLRGGQVEAESHF